MRHSVVSLDKELQKRISFLLRSERGWQAIHLASTSSWVQFPTKKESEGKSNNHHRKSLVYILEHISACKSIMKSVSCADLRVLICSVLHHV